MLFPSDVTMYEEFAGCGGTSSGATKVPGLRLIAAANHNEHAIASHEANFPGTEHFQEDISKLPVEKMPYATIFGGSPVCPPWSDARGKRRDFDKKNAQQTLFGEASTAPDEKTMRGRLLMWEPLRYLRAMKARHGRPVLGGVIENVIQARLWEEWDKYIGEYRKEGYHVRVVAFNSMHADAPRSPRAPQSRDRLYIVFWHVSLGRNPDFDKWLRPAAPCGKCGQTVDAMQVFKKFGADMGRYGKHGQYVYRCPKVSCRYAEVVPETLPALAAIDPSLPGVRIGDRAKLGMPELVDATLARIRAGIRKYWAPLLVPTGGTWRKNAIPLAGATMPTRTTSDCDGVAVPAFSLPPFITPMRGGGDLGRARSVFEPVHTVTAGGNHHGFAMPPASIGGYKAAEGSAAWRSQLLVPFYSRATTALPASDPVGTLTTKDRYGVLTPADLDMLAGQVDLDDVLFRMLQPHEIALAMAFDDDYKIVAPTREIKIMLYGNAVTPPVAELLYSALMECITGESLPRERFAPAG